MLRKCVHVDTLLRYRLGCVCKMLCCFLFFLFLFLISGLFSNEILHSYLYLFILFPYVMSFVSAIFFFTPVFVIAVNAWFL